MPPVPRSAALELARKDLLVEARTRDMAALGLLVVALILFLLRAASEGTPVPVGTSLWVALIFASTAGLARSFHAEADLGTLDLLCASPAAPASLYLGKTLSSLAVALLTALAAVLLCAAFFGTDFLREPAALAGFLVLGCVGLSAQASFFSALSARSRTRSALFPVLLIPLALPLMYWAARGTVAASLGAGFDDPAVWLNLALVAAYDAVFLPLNSLLVSFALHA